MLFDEIGVLGSRRVEDLLQQTAVGELAQSGLSMLWGVSGEETAQVPVQSNEHGVANLKTCLFLPSSPQDRDRRAALQ